MRTDEGIGAILFAASAAVTVHWARPMSAGVARATGIVVIALGTLLIARALGTA
jgi:hypothetical protein